MDWGSTGSCEVSYLRLQACVFSSWPILLNDVSCFIFMCLELEASPSWRGGLLCVVGGREPIR